MAPMKPRDDDTTPIRMIELLWQMDHAMQARSKRMQRTLGVTGPQRVVLRRLESQGAMSPNALAVALHLHPSTLTGILQRLESGQFITRKRHATDSRKMLIELTSRGKKLARRTSGSIEAIVAKVFALSTEDEIACMQRVLGRLVSALE